MAALVARYFGWNHLALTHCAEARRWAMMPALLVWSAVSAMMWAVVLTTAGALN